MARRPYSLRRRFEELSKLYEARESFLALAAHELRTPTTALRTQAQLLLRQLNTLDVEKVRQGVTNIERQTARLARLVNDLLDISRIEASKLKLQREPVNALALATELVERFSTLSERHSFALADGARGAFVLADPARLDQVLSNLLSNAVKFSDRGEVRLELSASRPEVVFAVSDRGPGIAKSKQRTLFARFHQVDSGRRGGLGLGLYLCKELVQRMGGRIWLKSTGVPGRGTCVRVALPRARAHS